MKIHKCDAFQNPFYEGGWKFKGMEQILQELPVYGIEGLV